MSQKVNVQSTKIEITNILKNVIENVFKVINGVCSNNLSNTKVLINFQNWKFKLSGNLMLEALISIKFHFRHLNFNKFPF